MFNTSAKRILCAVASFGGFSDSTCDHRELRRKEPKNDDNDKEFNDHIAKFGESYQTQDEFRFRKAVFKNNKDKIKKVNEKSKSYKLADNQFSTWTDEEFNNLLGLAEDVSDDEDDRRMLRRNRKGRKRREK